MYTEENTEELHEETPVQGTENEDSEAGTEAPPATEEEEEVEIPLPEEEIEEPVPEKEIPEYHAPGEETWPETWEPELVLPPAHDDVMITSLPHTGPDAQLAVTGGTTGTGVILIGLLLCVIGGWIGINAIIKKHALRTQ